MEKGTLSTPPGGKRGYQARLRRGRCCTSRGGRTPELGPCTPTVTGTLGPCWAQWCQGRPHWQHHCCDRCRRMHALHHTSARRGASCPVILLRGASLRVWHAGQQITVGAGLPRESAALSGGGAKGRG